MLPLLTALIPYKSLSHGRTRPTLVSAEDGDGRRHEVVVKNFLPEERGRRAAIAELVCALLGNCLGLKGPQPFLVNLPEGFHELLADDVARERLRTAQGLQFASAYLPGATTVAADRMIPESKYLEASAIFAFDCLVQNPDRRSDKPNLLEYGGGYWIIDHDMALAFVGEAIIGGAIPPWEPRALGAKAYDFLGKHLFTRGLRGKEDVLDTFGQHLANLHPGSLEGILREVPPEWWPDQNSHDSLLEYLNLAVSSADKLIAFAKTFLKP